MQAASRLTPLSAADAFLAALVDHEKRGVPRGAGAAGSATAFPLERMHALLSALGDPHARLPVIHVAGSKGARLPHHRAALRCCPVARLTRVRLPGFFSPFALLSGKGSTAAFAAAILRAAGYHVAVYSSPHAEHVSERFQSGAGGAALSRGAFDTLVAKHADAIADAQSRAGGALTHFEVTTALALRHFADAAPDCAVVEVGLGGTADATNVFDPRCVEAAVITTLDKEHTAALGGTIAAIARAKAGILRRGRPGVISPGQRPAAAAALRALSRAAGAVPFDFRRMRLRLEDALAPADGGRSVAQAGHLSVRYAPAGWDNAAALVRGGFQMRMVGPHQAGNLAAAVAAVVAMAEGGPSEARVADAARKGLPEPQWRVPASAFGDGIAAAMLPGRFFVSSQRATADGRSGAPTLVADGAHSPAAAAALAAALRMPLRGGGAAFAPLAFVVAMAADKDAAAIFDALAPLRPRRVVATRVAIAGAAARGAEPATLAAAWNAAVARAGGAGPAADVAPGLEAALAAAADAVGPNGTVVVTGSLHAAWAVQHALQTRGAKALFFPATAA